MFLNKLNMTQFSTVAIRVNYRLEKDNLNAAFKASYNFNWFQGKSKTYREKLRTIKF